MHPDCTVRLWLGLAALSCVFVVVAAADAQTPVITDPGDLRVLSVNTVLRPLDPRPEWTSMAPMPTARAGFAIATADQKIYAIGGAVINDCTITSTVEAYDPTKDLWITGLAPLPPPRRWRPAGSELGSTIYVIGGTDTIHGCPGRALPTVHAYDPTANKWSQKSSLNIARAQAGVGADTINNLLYAVGGTSGSPDFAVLDTVEVFNPAGGHDGKGSWTRKRQLNTARALPAVAAVNGKIYAIGGQTPGNGVIDTVEEFDPNAHGGFGAWTTKASRMPHPRLNPGSAVLNGKIYVIGGRTDVLFSSVDVYDPVLDVWTTGVPLPTARRGLGAAVVDDNIYAIGGEALVTTVNQQFTYQITGANNPLSYDVFPLPDGLSIDHERGIISGIPTTPDSSFVATFTATNSSGSDSRDVSFYIAAPLPSDQSSIASSTCVTGRAGQPFTFQVLTNNAGFGARLTATGLPYEAGVGPEVTLDPGTGLITGTVLPTPGDSAQSFGVGLSLTDTSSAQSYLQLTFVSDLSFPVITSSSNATLVLNQFFSYTIAADAPVSSFDYLGLDGILDGSLPPGLSFKRSMGTISGIYRGDLASKRPLNGATARHRTDNNAMETIKKEPPPKIQMLTKRDGFGTGTAPLNFFIGLHDFEVETLPSTTSKGTDYVILTDDPLTSGSGAGLVEAAKTGDYVNYTVAVRASGTYDVKAGIRTSNNQGIFQLSIDGANQGSPQDEYSSVTGYNVRDLGSVTFSSAGEKNFQFLVTGRNLKSDGYQLVFDYLDLVPRFQADAMVARTDLAPSKTIHDPSLSDRAATLFKASRSGGYFTYTVPVATAGIYNVLVKTKEGGSGGGFRLSIDGAPQGYQQRGDCGSSGGDGYFDLGIVYFRSAGEKAFQFQLQGCGPNSPGDDFALDYIDLALATNLEAEDLSANASTELDRITDARMSARAGVVLDAQAPGDTVNFNVTIPIAGTYDVKIGVRTGQMSGIFQLAIDSVNQGTAQDGFSKKIGYQVLDLGRVTFPEAGEKTFQFVVLGKNSSSSGYQLILDYIDLVR